MRTKEYKVDEMANSTNMEEKITAVNIGEIAGPSKEKEQDSSDGETDCRADRQQWNNQAEYLLCCVGYVAGFGNLWRFPYLVYKHGGAAFLIPYTLMMAAIGVPLMCLELSLGQFTGLGHIQMIKSLSPAFVGVGWGMLVITAVVAVNYAILIAWAVVYAVESFAHVLPWAHCDNPFNSALCTAAHHALACHNQSLHYYHRQCITTEEYCAHANLTQYNTTHCTSTVNATLLQPVTGSLDTVSASEDFFMQRMMRITSGFSWGHLHDASFEAMECLLVVWVLVVLCLCRGVRSAGKAAYLTATLPYLILLAFLIRVLTLEGGREGLQHYLLRCDLSSLNDIHAWGDAAVQVFFSLGTSFGGLISFASYTRYRNNCIRDAFIISLANYATSVFCGFVILGLLGFMANYKDTSVPELLTSGDGLSFILYAEAVTAMPLSSFWSKIFFLMLIALGLDTQFTMVETLVTAIVDHWPVLRRKRLRVVTLLCLCLAMCGLPLVLEGGHAMLELFSFYSAGISIVVFATCEVMLVAYLYGTKKFLANLTDDMGISLPQPVYWYLYVAWHFITPFALLLLLAMCVAHFTPAFVDPHAAGEDIETHSWLMAFAALVCLPVGAVAAVFSGKYTPLHEFRTTQDFCPAHVRATRKDASSSNQSEGPVSQTEDGNGQSDASTGVQAEGTDQSEISLECNEQPSRENNGGNS